MTTRSVTSLRAMILVGILGIEVLTAVAFIAATYPYARSTSLEHADSRLNSALDLSLQEAERFADGVGRLAELIDTLSASEVLHLEETEPAERFFAEVLRSEPRLSGIFLGTETGSFVYVTQEYDGLGPDETLSRLIIQLRDTRWERVHIRGPDFGIRRELEADLGQYDPRERPWYANARARDGIVWSEPYMFFTSQQPGITVSRQSRVGTQEAIDGVIGLDVSLVSLSAFTNELRASQNGILAVVDASGRVLAHPQVLSAADVSSMEELPQIQDGDDPVLLAAMQAAGLLNDGAAPAERQSILVEVDGAEHLVAFDFLSTMNRHWVIAARVPVDDFLGWFDQVIYATVLLTIALALFGTAGGLVLWSRIGRRLRRMQTAAADLANDSPVAFEYARSGFRELEATENALAQMSSDIISREKELRDTNTRIRQIMRAVDQMPVGVVVFEAFGPIHFINSLAATILRFEGHHYDRFDEENATRIADMRTNVNPDAPDLISALRSGSRWDADIVYDGHDDAMTFRAVAVPIERGESPRWVFALEDRTQQRRVENDLRNAYDAALEASTAKTNFLANMSHELRTPLNAILGYSQALLSGVFGEIGDQKHLRYIENIEESGQALHETLTNLLDLTAIESGSMRLKADFLNLDDIVKAAARSCEHALSAAGIQAELDLSTPDPMTLDGVKVRQAIINLIQNSCKYAENASTLVIRTRLLEENFVRIEVEDDGPGIPETMREEALRPFRRSDADAQIAIDNGVGLGLPIAKAIAELHGGYLSLGSAASDGTGLKVTMTFPRTRQD